MQAPANLSYDGKPKVVDWVWTLGHQYSKRASLNSDSFEGGAQVRYTVSPALPPGLHLNPSNGMIRGSPSSLGVLINPNPNPKLQNAKCKSKPNPNTNRNYTGFKSQRTRFSKTNDLTLTLTLTVLDPVPDASRFVVTASSTGGATSVVLNIQVPPIGLYLSTIGA